MKPYKVVFAMSYEVQAEDENDAKDKAEKLFVEDVDERKCKLVKLFKVTCVSADSNEKSDKPKERVKDKDLDKNAFGDFSFA